MNLICTLAFAPVIACVKFGAATCRLFGETILDVTLTFHVSKEWIIWPYRARCATRFSRVRSGITPRYRSLVCTTFGRWLQRIGVLLPLCDVSLISPYL